MSRESIWSQDGGLTKKRPSPAPHGIRNEKTVIYFLADFKIGSTVIKNPPGNAADMDLIPRSGRFPWVGHGNPPQYSLPGKFHGQRSLVGYFPLGCKELDTTGHICMHTQHIADNKKELSFTLWWIHGLSCPLQLSSCLEPSSAQFFLSGQCCLKPGFSCPNNTTLIISHSCILVKIWTIDPNRHFSKEDMANGCKKDVQHHYSSGKCTSEPQDVTSDLFEWLGPQKDKNRECWRGCVHREHLCTAGSNVNWCNLYRKIFWDSSKILKYNYHRSSNSTSGYLSKENENTNL